MRASQPPTATAPEPPAPTAPTQAATAGVGAPAAGLALGRYRLGRRLGAGAFGTVWMAHDERLDRAVAVKVVPRERVSQARLEREARAAARLSHPAIVTLYEAAVDDDCAYLVSELVHGHTLHELLSARRLSDRDVVTIALALCDALAHAHAHGVIHRDVKPSNVLVPERPSHGSYPAKLTDFGVARVIGGDSLTRTGDILGTADYMAPEQAEGLDAGPAADLYALALVTYEALTGVNPIRTPGARARRLGTYLPPLRRHRRDLPRDLGRAIDLALRPRPRERGTLAELREGLAASLPALDDTPGTLAVPAAAREAAALAFAAVPGPPSPEAPPPAVSRPRLPARIPPAVLAATATAWLIAHAFGSASVAPAAAGALAAAMAVLALPRAGWLLLATSLAAATAAAGHIGIALLIVLTLPLPALSPPGPRTVIRAWQAACAWLWLVVAPAIAGHDLVVGRAPGTAAPRAFGNSLTVTVHDVLGPLLRSGAPAGAVVCAVAVAAAPWLVRPAAPQIRLVFVTVWAAASLSALQAVIAATAAPGRRATLHDALPAVVAAAAALLGASMYRGARRSAGAVRGPGTASQVP